MPQEPKKRHSRARKGKRRAAISLKPLHLVTCLNCKAMILPHAICPSCGYYKGRDILNLKKNEKSS